LAWLGLAWLGLAWITWSKREERITDELFAMVVAKTEGSKDVAPMATVPGRTFVKDRLSAGLGEHIDSRLVQGGKGRPLSELGGLGKLGKSEFW